MHTGNPRCVVNCSAYDHRGQRRDIVLDEIAEAMADREVRFVWVGLYQPEEALLEQLQATFDLHDLAVEDAHNAHQRSKIEGYGGSLFIALRTAQRVDDAIGFGETQIFVGERYFITVRHGASISYAPARARMEREPELLRHGPGAALYAVLDMIVDNYQPIVDEFDTELNLLERDILGETFHPRVVRRLYTLKRELTRLRMSVSPLQDLLGQLSRTRHALIDDDIQPYFRDVHDHVLRMNEITDMLREMLTAAVSTNLSLVTVQQGETVKRLGAWAALLAAPTLITSWYGMNFVHMPELDERYAYAALIGVVSLTSYALYRLFRRAGWL
ncbi:magnesium and cobalt transport protein CorA [Lysobacter maris]|uniref:Magnesium and cobalt transport protein CorA n=1 Tax=Marilutibacter maris TaxID=1605891 RepID=A0A508BDB7_9GAMM|nr:magnesium and cobalt transport protein CorA [Lysobacter maris]KAB8198517.1 magnesium and cobalt transport protein CorA [Lysobacter maris]